MRRLMITFLGSIIILSWGLFFLGAAWAGDLPDIKKQQVLRHLGIPYANFVTGSGDGMDTELMKLFAAHLGVRYEYVATSWDRVIADLTGKKVKARGDDIEIVGTAPIRGDVIANGFTILPWRQKIVAFSTPIFPTQVWLVARADSPLQPITPRGNLEDDIQAVKALLKGRSLLGKANTCLDPGLYKMQEVGATIQMFPGGLNDLAPAVIKGDAETTLLDVPDALVALEKFPGKIKIIGPLTPWQEMGCAFAQTSPQLRQAFNEFLHQLQQDGTFMRLLKKYYPAILDYHPGFFAGLQTAAR